MYLLRQGLPEVPLPFGCMAVAYCTSTETAEGRANERIADCEVIQTAQAIRDALAQEGYQVGLVDLGRSKIYELLNYNWVFNLTETIFGFPLADYQIAEVLENLGIHFTGSGSRALKACLDKAVTKARLIQAGIRTPAYQVIRSRDSVTCRLPFPVIVKPVHEDGSIGITCHSVVHSPAEFRQQVRFIHRLYHQAALVETYIEGRDITVSILGNGEDVLVLPPSECVYLCPEETQILTFESKWEAGSQAYHNTVGRCPCDLPPDVERALKEIALRACQVMGCQDYARVDFRLEGETPYVLEVNPNPCINPEDTGYVRAARAAGFSYPGLIHAILYSSHQSYCLYAEDLMARSLPR